MPHLYALKEDLDMLAQSVKHLQGSYNAIDEIAKHFKNLWEEQKLQAQQMRRIEDDVREIKLNMKKMEQKLDQKIDKIMKHLNIS